MIVKQGKPDFRIYRPTFVNPSNLVSLKRDVDKELENISQALIWVTEEIKKLTPVVQNLYQVTTELNTLKSRVAVLESKVP